MAYLELNLDNCLNELKRSPFLILDWKNEIIKSARLMEKLGKSCMNISRYLKRNYDVLRRLKGRGYDDLLKKPLAEFQMLINEYEKEERRGRKQKVIESLKKIPER